MKGENRKNPRHFVVQRLQAPPLQRGNFSRGDKTFRTQQNSPFCKGGARRAGGFEKIFLKTCQVLKIDPTTVSANVFLVSKCRMKKLNKKHRGVNSATDVLSFPMLTIKAGEVPTKDKFPLDQNPETGKIELGDIVICPRVAKRQAREIGQSFEQEIKFLYTHGLLHLLGYDHETEEDEERMLRIQLKIKNEK